VALFLKHVAAADKRSTDLGSYNRRATNPTMPDLAAISSATSPKLWGRKPNLNIDYHRRLPSVISGRKAAGEARVRDGFAAVR
jgi:hypothetical protein